MIALIQRVRRAHVEVHGVVVGSIDYGLLVLVCAEPQDTELLADKLVDKLLKLRVFSDDQGKMNRSVVDEKGGLLLVSQFTLAADTQSGNRPSFMGAAPPELGRHLYERVVRTALHCTAAAFAGRYGRIRRRHASASDQRWAGDDTDDPQRRRSALLINQWRCPHKDEPFQPLQSCAPLNPFCLQAS